MTRDFDATVRSYRDAITRRCKWMCRTGWMDPEDLQQEFWLDVARMWPRIDPDVGITALLFRILGSTASRLIHAMRAEKRTGVVVPLEDWDGGAVAADQETAFELAETIAAIDSLPRKERDILVARAMGEGLREIGETLGVSTERARQIETAARRRLLTGKQAKGAKLDAKKVAEIRARLADGVTGKEIEYDYGVSQTIVSLIRHRRIWKDVA